MFVFYHILDDFLLDDCAVLLTNVHVDGSGLAEKMLSILKLGYDGKPHKYTGMQ